MIEDLIDSWKRSRDTGEKKKDMALSLNHRDLEEKVRNLEQKLQAQDPVWRKEAEDLVLEYRKWGGHLRFLVLSNEPSLQSDEKTYTDSTFGMSYYGFKKYSLQQVKELLVPLKAAWAEKVMKGKDAGKDSLKEILWHNISLDFISTDSCIGMMELIDYTKYSGKEPVQLVYGGVASLSPKKKKKKKSRKKA
jgi:hypothetical protein